MRLPMFEVGIEANTCLLGTLMRSRFTSGLRAMSPLRDYIELILRSIHYNLCNAGLAEQSGHWAPRVHFDAWTALVNAKEAKRASSMNLPSAKVEPRLRLL